MSEKKYEARRKALLANPKNGYDRVDAATREAIFAYAEGYKQFLDVAKTEREAVTEAIRRAEAAGFHAWQRGESLKPGDRVYYNNRGKAIMLAVIGEDDLSHGAHICAAHIDNPRLDLKPNPLYEDSEMAFFKTHYYGGIKKYQWTTVPLALHGVVALKDGAVVNVCIGEDESDPVLVITDLLIHLASDQMRKTLAEGVTGEQLNVLLGSMPLPEDEEGDRVKFAVMCLLNDRYGITEEDFLSAELTMVPAQKAKDVGLDRSLVGAFGHDDRVCAYAALEPMLRLETPKTTAVCVLADKEEIGSEGVSGMQSQAFETFMDGLCKAQGVDIRVCFEHSCCLSTDVTNAFDPTFAEVSDKRNNTRVNYGLGLCKYTGSRGKSGASDAAAELVGRIRALFDANGVLWQMGELGRVDQGGGGTVACYMANRNIDTLDAGVPVLSMHAPFEVISKLDLYMAARGNEVFYKA